VGAADGCARGRGRGNLSSLEAIARDYVACYRARAAEELDFFAKQPSFVEAIRKAGLAEGKGGRRFAHERRRTPQVLQECARYLVAAAPELRRASSFEIVHDVVRREIRGISGIGHLTVYDAALRIAAWLKLEPARVYLHAGTRVGARHLGLDGKAESLSVRDLPAPLRVLRPHELEDVLCIYKDDFGRLARAKGA
jgi:hypothetical protein